MAALKAAQVAFVTLFTIGFDQASQALLGHILTSLQNLTATGDKLVTAISDAVSVVSAASQALIAATQALEDALAQDDPKGVADAVAQLNALATSLNNAAIAAQAALPPVPTP